MYKKLLVLLAVIAITPACKKGKKTIKDGEVIAGYVSDKKGIFDEDVEAFVLEDDQNPFAPAQSESVNITLIDDIDDSTNTSRETQSQFGLKTIYFDFDHYNIREDQKNMVHENAKKVNALLKKGHTVVIEGHACNSAGSKQYNMHLSEKRAQAIRKALVKEGVPSNHIKTVGRGCETPVIQNGSREQQAGNRRAEYFVIEVQA